MIIVSIFAKTNENLLWRINMKKRISLLLEQFQIEIRHKRYVIHQDNSQHLMIEFFSNICKSFNLHYFCF